MNTNLAVLSERMKTKKCNKLVCNLHNKKEDVAQIAGLKRALNHGLIFKIVHRVTQFNQKAWLKPYIKMNAKLRTEANNDFEKDFFKLTKNLIFGKTMENIRKHRDIKLVSTGKRINQLVPEPNYHTTEGFQKAY